LLAKSKHKDNPWEILNTPDHNGLTPLILAKYYKIKELLKYWRENFGEALIYSTKEPQNIDELLKADLYGRTSLTKAIINDDLPAIKLALQNCTPDEINPQSGLNALQLACYTNASKQTVTSLLAKTTDLCSQDPKGRTALHLTASMGNISALGVLLASQAIKDKINTLDHQQRTALHAVVLGYGEKVKRINNQVADMELIVDLLFKHGIDFNARDIDEKTALDLAYEFGNDLIAQRINACIKQQNNDQYLMRTTPTYSPGFNQFTLEQQACELQKHELMTASHMLAKFEL
jgi:ankyrin repeat protein